MTPFNKLISLIICLAAVNTQSSSENWYNHYGLTMEWIGSVCTLNVCDQSDGVDKNGFNLHGLWPNNPSITGPWNCTDTPLDWDQISIKTQKELNYSWSGLYNSQQDFISHEWDKHGTCWDPNSGDLLKMPYTIARRVYQAREDQKVQNPTTYLGIAMDLRDAYDFYAMLERAKITPGNKYQLAQLFSSFSFAYGVQKFTISCLDDESGNQMFGGYMICLDLNYRPIDCPSMIYDGCRDDIVNYPTIPPYVRGDKENKQVEDNR